MVINAYGLDFKELNAKIRAVGFDCVVEGCIG